MLLRAAEDDLLCSWRLRVTALTAWGATRVLAQPAWLPDRQEYHFTYSAVPCSPCSPAAATRMERELPRVSSAGRNTHKRLDRVLLHMWCMYVTRRYFETYHRCTASQRSLPKPPACRRRQKMIVETPTFSRILPPLCNCVLGLVPRWLCFLRPTGTLGRSVDDFAATAVISILPRYRALVWAFIWRHAVTRIVSS